MQVETAALAYAIRWHYAFSDTLSITSINNDGKVSLSQTCPFHDRRKEPPCNNPEIEKSIMALYVELDHLTRACKMEKGPQNVTIKEREAIVSLRDQQDTTLVKSDKGGEFVVMRTSNLKRLCMEHLNETSTYRRLEVHGPEKCHSDKGE